jgi:hypothetical protein
MIIISECEFWRQRIFILSNNAVRTLESLVETLQYTFMDIGEL